MTTCWGKYAVLTTVLLVQQLVTPVYGKSKGAAKRHSRVYYERRAARGGGGEYLTRARGLVD